MNILQYAALIFIPNPILIDFGISFSMNTITSNLEKYFYRFDPTEYIWPIDVHILTYIVQISDLNMNAIEKITTQFVQHHKVLKTYPSSERKEYINDCIQYYSSFIPLSTSKAIVELIKGWKTWDAYSATVFIYSKLYAIDPTHSSLEHLKTMFHYNPYKRLISASNT